MTWVPRIPMRPDFCGCPPCPWCYAWAGDEPCDGVTKMARDLLGGNPTPVQVMQLEAGAQLVHANNLARKEADLAREQDARQAEDEKWSERRANAFLAEKRKQVERPVAKIDTRPVLDDLPLSAFEEKKPEVYEVTLEGLWSTYARSAMERKVFWTAFDTSRAIEEKPKAAEKDPKWGGGDVKKRAEKEARRARDAMLRR